MTSVKDIHVEEPATRSELGRGSFVFSDDYSVFDWGTMPDTIPEKGKSLCTMGAFNFEFLEDNGVPTHYRGVVENDTIVQLDSISEPPDEMAIELAQVPDLPYTDSYDYDAYHAAAGDNFVIPLEIVFRNDVPVGSSLRRRTEPADHGLDYDEWPAEAIDLDAPIVEFSTKYEEQDRYLARSEADTIAGSASLDELDQIARQVNDLVTTQAQKTGFTHHDGKIECVYYQGEIRVADVVGTFDENRFSYNNQQVSKEILRQYYKSADPEWVDAVSAAKTAASEQGIADWRSLCNVQPDPLPESVITIASDLYTAGANTYINQSLFPAPSLDDAIAAVQTL